MTRKKKQPLPRYLTDGERVRLIDAVRAGGRLRDIALFEMVLQYGLRPSEVGLLTREAVDFDTGRLAVQRLKNGIDNELPLIDPAKTALRTYLESREDDREELIPGKRGPLGRKGFWELMQSYGKTARLPTSKRHPHVLRHTAAVRALDAGLGIVDVQDMLGHAAITSTQVYARISDKKRRASFDQLEKANGHF